MATLAFSWVPGLNDVLGWCLQKTAWLLNAAVVQTGQLPGAAWDGLWLSAGAMLLVYTVILCSISLVLTRHRAYLWATCVAALLLAGLTLWNDYAQQQQQKLAVHFLPHRTAVSLTHGQASLLLTDLDPADTRSYDFYLKNTFGQWGIRNIATTRLTRTDGRALSDSDDSLAQLAAYHRTSDYALWVWRGKTLLLVNKLTGKKHWKLPAVVDYLIIRRNALHDWNQLTGRVVARHIIFDDSNKTPLTDKLLADARQRGIACYSVRQMGAYVADLK